MDQDTTVRQSMRNFLGIFVDLLLLPCFCFVDDLANVSCFVDHFLFDYWYANDTGICHSPLALCCDEIVQGPLPYSDVTHMKKEARLDLIGNFS